MAGITLATAEARLEAYLVAEAKVLSGQAYTFEGRVLTRANMGWLQKGILYWEARVKRLSGSGGIKVSLGVPK